MKRVRYTITGDYGIVRWLLTDDGMYVMDPEQPDYGKARSLEEAQRWAFDLMRSDKLYEPPPYDVPV